MSFLDKQAVTNLRTMLQRLYNPVQTEPYPSLSCVLAVGGDSAVSVANSDVTITYPARVGSTHLISGIAWSYDDTPTGRITVDYAGHRVFDIDITQGGPGFIPFDPPKCGRLGLPLSITLYAGGAGIIGKLNIISHWWE